MKENKKCWKCKDIKPLNEFYPTLILLEGTEVKRYVGKNQIKSIL